MASTVGARYRLAEAYERLRRDHAFQNCLLQGPNCRGPIARAHSVQNSRSLSVLERNGKVYMFRPNRDGPGMGLKLVARSQATVFTGLCGSHDNSLFREIDTAAPGEMNVRLAVLHSLRAAAKEFWEKLNVIKTHGRLLELCRTSKWDEIAELLQLDPTRFDTRLFEAVIGGTFQGYESSGARMGARFASLLEQVRSGKYHLTDVATFEFAGKPNVGASASATPEFDFGDRRIATIKPTGYQADLFMCVTPFSGRTIVSMTSHRRDRKALGMLQAQLEGMSTMERGTAVSRFLIVNSENVAYAPEFVDGMPQELKAEVELAFSASIEAAIPYSRVPDLNLFGGN